MADQGNSNGDITLKMVIDHMQAGFIGVRGQIKQLDDRLHALEMQVDAGFKNVHQEFTRVWRRFDWMDTCFDNLNVRLDDLELANLPRRVAALERKVGNKR